MKIYKTKDNLLCGKLGRKESFDAKELELITNSSIAALVAPQSIRGRKSNIIGYDVAPFTTLKFYISCILDRQQFVDMVCQCIQVFFDMKKLYLSMGRLLTGFDQIYVTLTEKRLHFIYLPVMNYDVQFSESEFFGRLLEATPCTTHDFLLLAQQVKSFLARPVPFSLSEFDEFFRAVASAVNQDVQRERVYVADRGSGVRHVHRPETDLDMDIGLRDGGTVLLGDTNDALTVMLVEEAPPPKGRLVRLKTGQEMTVGSAGLRLGKEAGRVDWLIADNGTISRLHASIICRDGGFYLVDNKSLNKTYLNDIALEPEVEVPLESGAGIRLSNEAFSFELCQDE